MLLGLRNGIEVFFFCYSQKKNCLESAKLEHTEMIQRERKSNASGHYAPQCDNDENSPVNHQSQWKIIRIKVDGIVVGVARAIESQMSES